VARRTVKNFVSERGFGFITPEENAPSVNDLFIHRHGVQSAVAVDAMQSGQGVEYDLGWAERRRGFEKPTNARATA
jgi:cold shock CspA family protein